MNRAVSTAILCLAMTAVAAEARDPGSARKSALRHSTPTAPAQAAPDMTGTTTANGDTATAPKSDEEALPPLFNLPVATRARMRKCGETWQARKLSGEAGDDIWRDYATKCLSAKD